MIVRLEEAQRLKDKKHQNNAAIYNSFQHDDNDKKLSINSEAENLSAVTWPNKRKGRNTSNKAYTKKVDSQSRNSTSNETLLKENSSLES